MAERIIEAREGSWTVLVGTVVKSTRRPPFGRCGGGGHHEDDIASDALDYLFPSSNAHRGTGATSSLKMLYFDAASGDALHLEDESGRIILEPMTNDENGSGGGGRALDPNTIVTGVVIAVIGKVDADRGVMRVRSVHFAGPPPPTLQTSPATASSMRASDASLAMRGPTTRAVARSSGDVEDDDIVMEGENEYGEPVLLLVSGLGCGYDSPEDATSGGSLAVRREMLLEYLTNPKLSDGASVCRVIVAGGGVSPPPPPPDSACALSAAAVPGGGKVDAEDEIGMHSGGKRRRDYNVVAASESSTKNNRNNDAAMHVSRSLFELDLYLSELLGSGIPVDYVPGWHDPTNANWPQKPLHSCLLPRSAGYDDLFCRGTNPYECVLGGGGGSGDGSEEGGNGVRVLGSDGLNIADLRRFLPTTAKTKTGGHGTTIVDDADPVVVGPSPCIDALHRTLVYGHLAPTGPDSLPTFPSYESDPFVLTRRPNVYFAGNCDTFETRLVNGRGEEIIDDGGITATTTTTANDDMVGMTRLVCVPSFALTGEVVLVKLRSLECEVLTFNDFPNL